MGKLAMYGALGGIGKGLEQEYLLDRATAESEAKDARTFQLERMRQKAATERQKLQDTAASARLKEQYGPKGYAEQAAVSKEERAITATSVKQAHEITIEEMRQKGQTARETMRITEKDDPFEFKITKASTTLDPAGNITNVPAQNQVTDKATNVTYTQVGLAFVPEGWQPPPKERIQKGNSTLLPWVLAAPDIDTARERSLKFLEVFGYLPAQYFSKFGGRGMDRKITEKGGTTTTAPVNPVVQ